MKLSSKLDVKNGCETNIGVTSRLSEGLGCGGGRGVGGGGVGGRSPSESQARVTLAQNTP